MSAAKMKQAPALRFPEFTAPWKTDSIDSFVKRVNNPVAVEPDCMYRQIGVRSHGKGIFHKEPVTGKSLGEKRVFWVHPQAFVVNIVFGWEQAVALTSAAEDGYIASHRFPMFVPVENKTDLNFLLLFFLRKKGKYLLGLASPGGAGRNKTLGQNEFAKLDMTLPTLPEQQKIVSFAGAVDKKLEALCRKQELLKTYKRGLMEKLFSQELRFQADDKADFPDWEKNILGKVCCFIKDGTHGTHTDDSNGKHFLLSAKNLQNGKVKFDDTDRKISKDEYQAIYKNYMLVENDILLSIVGTIGRVAIFKDEENIAFQRSVAFFRLTDDIPSFFYQYMMGHSFQKELLCRQVVSAQPGIYLGDLAKIDISIPNKAEQQKIADFLSAIDAKIDAVAEQIEKMKQFKKGLLQQMFV